MQTEQALLGRLAQLGMRDRIRFHEGLWELLSTRPMEKPVRLDLNFEFSHWKRTTLILRNQPLYRALGVKEGKKPFVLDATSGLAGDSLQLLSMGCRVHGWERHPLVGLLLLRAYAAWQHEAKQYWTLELLEQTIPEDIDVIYFDPMFDEINDKALPRKEMRIFREVIGCDQDAQAVGLKLRQAGKRLIIKRPIRGEELLPGVSHSQAGKSVRFDVYLP